MPGAVDKDAKHSREAAAVALQLFRSIGLDERTAHNAISNSKLSAQLRQVISEAGVGDGCDGAVGNLLFAVATQYPVNALRHRGALLEYVTSYKIRSVSQLEGAFGYLASVGSGALDYRELEKRSGLGVDGSADRIRLAVEEVVRLNKKQLLVEPHRINVGALLGQAREQVPWADLKQLKAEMDFQLKRVLGESTALDEQESSFTKKKEKLKVEEPTKGAKTVSAPEPEETDRRGRELGETGRGAVPSMRGSKEGSVVSSQANPKGLQNGLQSPGSPLDSQMMLLGVDKKKSKKFLTIVRSIFHVSMPSLPCKWLALPPGPSDSPSLGSRITGTLFGFRKGHVHFVVQEDPKSQPVLLLELATPTSSLVKEMASGLVRIALECERTPNRGRLFQEPMWTMYCNGRKTGYAIRRVCSESDLHILTLVQAVSMGAGVLPIDDDGPNGELMYMRARFERVVGSRDSEAFYMMNPDGTGGPELSIFLLRI